MTHQLSSTCFYVDFFIQYGILKYCTVFKYGMVKPAVGDEHGARAGFRFR